MFQPKVSKHILHPASNTITLQNVQYFQGEIKICTDGSKINNGVGSAYCIFKNNQIIAEGKSCLSPKNSIYQAELHAILHALIWASSTNYSTFLILTDSLSSLLALQDLESSDGMVSTILQLLHNLHLSNPGIFFSFHGSKDMQRQ